MSNVYYTSDIHIGHKLVAGLRGFNHYDPRPQEFGLPVEAVPDTAAHDAWLADIWDKTLGPKDTVFVLGDISINGGQHALDWIAERPGTKHLIAGNHDPVNPMFRTAVAKLPLWNQYFETITPFMRRKLDGMNFLLSHFPYESWGDGPAREGSRHNQYRLPDMGLPLLHGHTHGEERAHGNMFHVGVDAWDGQLVRQDTIMDWLKELKEQQA